MTDSLSTIRHLLHPVDGGSVCPPAEIYRNAHGDVWELLQTTNPARSMVRHTLAATPGEATLVTVEEFLAVNCSGPEHAALRILLSSPGPNATAE